MQVPRLETLLIEYQGAEDSRYTREVTKKALVVKGDRYLCQA